MRGSTGIRRVCRGFRFSLHSIKPPDLGLDRKDNGESIYLAFSCIYGSFPPVIGSYEP